MRASPSPHAQIMQTFNRDTGAKESITYRCGDMDRQVPHIMGVSKVRRRLDAWPPQR